jgi:stage II sporulation protein AA (anti-sigma F factor antagonist)
VRILLFSFLSKVKKKERTSCMEIASVKCVMNKDTLNIEIEGDVDHHTAKFIRGEIDKAIFYYRPKIALLNVGRVDFMDSSGLGLILGRYTNVKEVGGILKIVDPSRETEKILALAGIERLIPIIRSAN